jgi:hypothetical protein
MRLVPRVLFAVAALAAIGVAQQRDFSKVEVKAEKVGGNVYMLTGS